MKHIKRITAVALMGALAALCIGKNPAHWQKPASATCVGEAPSSALSTIRQRAEIALHEFSQFDQGQGPTKLEPSTDIEVSIEEDLRMGQLCVVQNGPLVNDEEIEKYLNDRARELLVDAPAYMKVFPVRVFLNRDQGRCNAMAGGGGYLLMSVDRVARAPSEEFLLHALCHEMAHNWLRHAAKQQTLLKVLLEMECTLEAQLELDEVKANVLKHGRLTLGVKRLVSERMNKVRFGWHTDELEADVATIQLLHRAGYDTGKVTEEWWRMAPSFRLGPKELDTHPAHGTRALCMDRERDRLVDTPRRTRPADKDRFAAIQARAKALINSAPR